MRRDNIEVIIYTPQELNQSSYLRTGLFELAQRGIIRCRVSLNTSARLGRLDTKTGKVISTRQPHPKTSFYRLIDHVNGSTIDFAVDGYDVPWSFSMYALDHCQYIFKRNFAGQYIASLCDDHRSRIYPLGLTFMVRSNFSRYDYRLLSGLLLSNLNVLIARNKRLTRQMKKSVKHDFHHWQKIRKTRILSEFEKYSENKIKSVLFQTRCFPHVEDPDARNIHDERAMLIRTLKNNLGSYFRGGFIPDQVSGMYYNDCITDLPTEPHQYLKLVSESAIGIYTRGLNYSPAWKMAEYLAQGTCIVAEPLSAELPVPLVHGKHVYYFQNHDECLDICKMLLNDDQKRHELSVNARKYYEENISPAANVNRILNLMLNKKSEHIV